MDGAGDGGALGLALGSMVGIDSEGEQFGSMLGQLVGVDDSSVYGLTIVVNDWAAEGASDGLKKATDVGTEDGTGEGMDNGTLVGLPGGELEGMKEHCPHDNGQFSTTPSNTLLQYFEENT